MSEEKVPALEIEETEVKPVELPEGAKLGRSEGQQDFGKDPNAPEEETPKEPSNDSGKFPRATERRDRKAEAKKIKDQKRNFQKYMQQMRRPVRHGELPQIIQHIDQMVLGPRLKKLDELVDKLQLLPDFIGNCLSEEGKFDIEPSLETFDEFYENYMKKLEEEAAKLEEEEAKKKEEEGSSTSPSEPTTSQESTKSEGEDTPKTEETQKE